MLSVGKRNDDWGGAPPFNTADLHSELEEIKKPGANELLSLDTP